MTLSAVSASAARILARDLPTVSPGEQVTVMGWVHRRRFLSSVTFLVVRDRTGLSQVVVTDPDTVAGLDVCPEETTVAVTGTATPNAAAPGGVELTNPTIEALTSPAHTPPVELWRPTLRSSLPVTLDHAAVTWRHPVQRARWEIAAASLRGFRHTLDGQGFTEVQTPKLVSSATESGASVFEVDYFGRRAFLAQSPQFYKQTLVGVFERVYETGPVFRAEPHDTVRHLAEYVSLDAELGFIRDHHDVLHVLRRTLAGMAEAIEEGAAEAVERLGVTVPVIPEQIPVIHFRDALRLVGAAEDEPDLRPEHERFLGQWAQEKYRSDFLAVEGYPMTKRPFYTHPSPQDPRWSNSFDLLFRGIELVTGGQRLHQHHDYLQAIGARGEDPNDYTDYLHAFLHGMPPHGGFAIGLERWASRITGADNVREVRPFPRDLHRITP